MTNSESGDWKTRDVIFKDSETGKKYSGYCYKEDFEADEKVITVWGGVKDGE